MRISDWSSDVCSSDLERVGQGASVALDGYLALLHRLEQGGLRLRRRAVDLVGEQQVCEHRPLTEAERPRSAGCRVRRVDELAQQLGGHQVGRELDPCEVERQRSEEHTSELQSLMRSSYAVFCLKKKK